MKIMFAVAHYWPSQDGVTQITKYLAEGLAERGHEVLVYTGVRDGGLEQLPERDNHRGVSIERTRVYVRWPLKIKGRDQNSTKEKYYERICSFNPDALIVVCAQTWTLDWIIPYLDRIRCIKIFYSHGYSMWKAVYPIREKLKNHNILGVYEQWSAKHYFKRLHYILRKFDLNIYLSELNNSYLYAEKYGLLNGAVLENAVEDVFFADEMQHTPSSFRRPDIQYLYVANYNDNKNQDMLLKAFCDADIEYATLQFVGIEGNDYLDMLKDHLSRWLPENSSKKVVFNVHLSREEVCELYRSSDVFVCTSRSENCPVVHCEAAVTGMAVISTDVGDVRLKDGIILVESVEQLKEAMESLYFDREELRRRGEKLRNYMLSRNCRVEDKIDWLEAELKRLTVEKGSGA